MWKYVLLWVLLTSSPLWSQNGDILFFQTNWGNTLPWDAFCERAKKSGFDGIDVWLPRDTKSQEQLKEALQQHGLKLILMHGTNRSVPFTESLAHYKKRLYELAQWKPVLINSHTGSDFFSEQENTAFIKAAHAIAKETGVPVFHETHRGRFSYTLPTTLNYLSHIPELRLTADISHWMVVHESLLEGQDEQLREIIARTEHIHARVGHAEGPQVNDPTAPEWRKAVERHLDIWERIIRKSWAENQEPATVTTEFGPPHYLPALPFTQVPVSNQWEANVYIMNALKKRMEIN